MALRVGSINLIFCIIALVSSQDLESTEDEDSYCGIEVAASCFPAIEVVFQCYLNPLSPSCASYQQPPSQASLEGLCNEVQDSLNDCMLKLLEPCSRSDSKHGYFHQWLKPLNAVLDKLCSPENLKTLADSYECIGENLFVCITQYDHVDWIELITTRMSSDTCINVDLRVQQCLSIYGLPTKCISFNTILMEVAQEFIDHADCNNQPAILVPLDDKDSLKSSGTDEEIDDENARDCELSPFIISKCFQPFLSSWTCYFNSETKCNFRLEELCSSANESFNTCASNLIGYGCDGVPEHNFFKTWLSEFNLLPEEICTKDLIAADDKYFKGKTECWDHFFSCFQELENERQLINLITTKITGEICRDLGDKVEACLLQSLMSTTEDICDPVFEKIEHMKDKFTSGKACNPQVTVTSESQSAVAAHRRSSFQMPIISVLSIIIVLLLRL